MVLIGLRELSLGQRDGPLDVERGIREVDEGVGLLELGRPVPVDEVCVGRTILQGLEGVADAARDEDGPGRIERSGEDLAEGLAPLTQVYPCAEDGTRGHGDELVPRFRMNAARDAALGVEAHVVLNVTHVGDAQGAHLGALEVLLEPAAVIAVHRELDDLEPRDAGLGNGEVLLEFHLLCCLRLVVVLAAGNYLALRHNA